MLHNIIAQVLIIMQRHSALLASNLSLDQVDYLGGVVERSHFGHLVLHSRIVGELCERTAC